jgi:hypothetical protein
MEPNTGMTFDDVAGIDEAKQDFQEIVKFLKTVEKFAAIGARIPKGVLLVGPPGTEKMLLAKAILGGSCSGLVGSRAGLGKVLSGSWANPNQVLSRSWASPRKVLGGFLAGSVDLRMRCSKSKTVNHFLKIKEEFSVKGKYFLLTTVLHCSKYCKLRKSFSKNYFISK